MFTAVMMLAGPALFWAFIGLGHGMSMTGWAAGLAMTVILAILSYTYLEEASTGHGFGYWLLLTAIVASKLVVFCVMPYALVRGTIGSP